MMRIKAVDPYPNDAPDVFVFSRLMTWINR